MLYVTLPEEKTRKASFYLAMEEFVAHNVTNDDCLFYWQVGPSVVFGRNQLIRNEVNLTYCREHNINIFRRKSGGGCVYADKDNVMFSFITSNENVGFTFNRYINMMVLMLRKMGVNASATGRNDIMIDGKKVSGNAFYHIPGRSIVHGTMLYDTDMENMVNSITPADEKLKSKGVESVRQHVALLKDYISLDIEDFKMFIRRNLCDGEHMLTSHDIEEIEKIERDTYLSHDFIYGKDPRHTLTKRRRIEGVGDIEIHLEMKGDMIKGASLHGDFFSTGNSAETLLKRLENVRLERSAITDALPDNTENIILNLKKEDLINMLINNEN